MISLRLLRRNKRQIYYALFDRKEEIVDEYGNNTGEFRLIYSEPVGTVLNVSAARGESYTRQFGDLENYDKVIVANLGSPIVETTVIWVDSLDTTQPYDYVVRKVATSLNNKLIAISKVSVGDFDITEEDDDDD